MKVDKKYLSKSVNMWYYRGRIRIEPDWNVKSNNFSIMFPEFPIRIEPDWNVKPFFAAIVATTSDGLE